MALALLTDIDPGPGSKTTVSGCKLALVTLASFVNPKAPRAIAFPSMAEREKRSGQDKRTIRLCDAELIRLNLIADTGERRGRTGQITVYSFPRWEASKRNNVAPLSTSKAERKEGQQEGQQGEQYCPPYRGDRSYPTDMSDREKVPLSNDIHLSLSGDAEQRASTWPADHLLHVERKFRAHYGSERHARSVWDARWCKWVLNERDVAPSDGPVNPLVRAALALKAEDERQSASWKLIASPYASKRSDHSH